jgi:hypothetical protein
MNDGHAEVPAADRNKGSKGASKQQPDKQHQDVKTALAGE